MNFKARIYALIVEMHPASFRHEFGLEMRLDFEEARKSHGVMPLYWDALLSVFRQWGQTGVTSERERVPAAARFLMEGRYGAIGGGGLSAFEFGRGTVLAVGLFGGLVLVQGRAVVHSSNDFASPNYSASDGFQPETARHTPANGARSQIGPRTSRPSYHSGPFQQAEMMPEDSAAMRSHFVRPLRISETVAMREIARTEAAQRVALVAAGEASAGTAAPREPEAPAGAGPSGHARVAGQILHATAPLPSFEVVSIRLWHRPPAPPPVPADQPGAPKPVMKVDPGSGRPHALKSARWHSIIPVQVLIATAYNLPPDSKRVTGGPGWLREDIQYEITATIGDEMFAAMQKMTLGEQQTQMQLMQQSLLADRFGLKLHFEQREMPMFTLEVAKGGPKLTPAAEGGTTRLENFADERGGGLKGTAVTLDQLTQSPLFLGGRVVENRTGLNGNYDFMLRFAGESGDGDAPGLYTALQDQMGLRLVPAKGMVEVLVIDAVEKPSEN
jgi:uncharacterized protein (TIGR03435 family)